MSKEEIKQAAALRYRVGDDAAPVVVAVGQGRVAEKMVEKAEEHSVPVVRDDNLAKVLAKLSVGDRIPEELYGIVAQVLVFVSRMDEGYTQRIGLDNALK